MLRNDTPLEWKEHTSPATAGLRGISTPTPDVAWVSGDNGTILRTTDSGEHWESKPIPDTDTLLFRSIKAFDANTAYVMSAGDGNESRIYKTSNGGSDWTLQYTSDNPAEFFNCLAFWDADHGMVLSDPVDGYFRLYQTDNGGATWIPVTGLPPALADEGAFAASGSCLMTEGKLNAWFVTGSNSARVFRTQDGGKQWSVSETPLTHATPSAGVFSAAFYDADHGLISGGDYEGSKADDTTLAITEDGGDHWQALPTKPAFYGSQAAYTPDHTQALVVGNTQAGLLDLKQPEAWRQTWKIGLNAFSFWTPKKVLAVGPEGRIAELKFTP